MPFPTHDEVAGVGAFLYYQSLENLLRRRAPEYADRIERPDARPFYLGIRLGDGAKVLLAQAGRAWAVAGPQTRSRPRLWSPGTPGEVLIDALREQASACLTGEPEPSPWCWDEAEESAQTRLAGHLVATGFDVKSVVSWNRAFADDDSGTPLNPAIRIAPRSDGAFVRARRGQLDVHVALKPSLGWIADIRMPEDPHWRRLDLAQLLTGRSSLAPGIASSMVDVPMLARVIASAVDGLLTTSNTPPPLAVSPLSPVGEGPANGDRRPRVAAGQLHTMGFGDVQVQDVPGSPLHSDTFHISWRDREEDSLGKPDLERLIGRSAAEGKSLIVVSGGRVTRDALAVANRSRASVFVFNLDPRDGLLFGGNDRSAEAYLTGTSPLEALDRLLTRSDIDARSLAGALGRRSDVGEIVSGLAAAGEGLTAAEGAVISSRRGLIAILREMVEDPSIRERDLQKLLEDEPWIFGSSYAGVAELRNLVPLDQHDIPLIRADGALHIVELKGAFIPELVKRHGNHWMVGGKVHDAVCQAMNYLRGLDEMGASLETTHRKELGFEYDMRRIFATVVIGHPVHVKDQNPQTIEETIRSYNAHLSRVEVVTYASLLDAADRALTFEDTARRGHPPAQP